MIAVNKLLTPQYVAAGLIIADNKGKNCQRWHAFYLQY